MKSVVIFFTVVASCYGMTKMPPAPAQKYPNFSRSCSAENKDDCIFKVDKSTSSVYLTCENDVCYCANNSPSDVLRWPLEWDENDKKECAIAKGGPCGEDRGLRIICQPDLQCIEGRCRNPAELYTSELRHSCNDNMDCKEGLVCQRMPKVLKIQISRCVKPDPEVEADIERTTTDATENSV